MITVAAMLAGLSALWLILNPSLAAGSLLAGAASVLFATLASSRLGLLDRESAAPITRCFALVTLALSRAPSAFAQAIAAARAAIAADVTLKPALVRMRTLASSDRARATFAAALGAAPGALVVETSADSMLLHVLDEDSTDPTTLAVLEIRAAHAVDGRAVS